jgi:tetratricopeptide (TPR) repeat protein
MKILFSFIFLCISASLFGAGSSSDNNKSDVSSDYLKAEKLIKKKNYEKAIGLLSDLLDEKPNGFTKSDVLNYLGFANRKKQQPNYELAEKYYLEALTLDPNHIGALEYLGELYVDVNQIDQAKDLLERLKNAAGENSEEYKELFALINN